MKIHTYWWGAEMFPESDEEWVDMCVLFRNATTIGCYECDSKQEVVCIDNGTGPVEEVHGEGEYWQYTRDSRPEAVQSGMLTERRCITVQR